MTSVVLPSDFVFPENLGTLLEEMKTLRTFSRRGSLEKPEEHGSTDIGTADLTSSRSTASTNDASPGLVTNEPPGVVGSHTEEYCFLLRRAIISIRVAEVLEEMGELTEACKWNNDADWLLTKAKCGAPLGLSNTRFHLASINNAAHILYRLRRYRDASALFRRALEVCDTAEMQLARVTIYCSLARTFEHMRLPSLVHEQYDAAARVCGQSAAKEMLKKHIDVLYLKAKYYLKSKNTNEAIQTYADVQTLLLQLTGGVSCLELCDSYAQTGALRALMNSHTLAVQDFGKALAGLKETQPPNQYNRNKMVRGESGPQKML
jgi:tetratricopeptide (TPR) repeat protein